MLVKDCSAVEVLFTMADAETLRNSLAECICYRCKQKYRHHQNADHLFFELIDEPEFEDAN